MKNKNILLKTIKDRKYDEIILIVLKHYGLDLVSLSFTEINTAYIVGRTVYLGQFEDGEKLLISIFHEVGHVLITKEFIEDWHYQTFIIELECWRIGLEEARKFDIYFSDDTIAWGLEMAMTYKNHDEREFTKEAWEEQKSNLFSWKDRF